MKGSIKKDNKTGKYYFVVDVGKDTTGKRIQKKRRGFESKQDAELGLAKFLSEFNKEGNISKIDPDISFGEYMEGWFIERRNLIERTTLNNQVAFYKCYIASFLGSKKLGELSPIILQNFANDLFKSKNLAAGTIHKIFDVLKVSLRKAVKLKIINENPCMHVELPKIRRKEMQVWNLQQVNKFLSEVKIIRNSDQFFTAYLLAITTGMRQGEILGLRWKDIDFDKKLIFVKQILTHDGKELKSGTKTVAGTRTISISENVCVQLLKAKEKVENDKQLLGHKYIDNDLVVCTKKGSVIQPSNLLKTFKKDTEKIGLPLLRFHDLRHTHATMLIEQDINPKIIQERLGHSRIGVTLDIYSHVLPSMQQHVADKLDEMVII
ncbi:site-specific integrase [Neobacillus cucumis]|uniref:Site-specific integrase n=1 Tax=Neobacillus cucumis TaxID=1740721 RepID=A0A2N5HEQ0_9BACI|nr:site-specific integrase [Neobacillus cucumis]PLS04004.1 site-specific integrase [Neobacillus cucumis]